MPENNRERKLTWREYFGAFLPPRVATREENPNPLTLREYIRAMPTLNLDEIVDLSKRTVRGIQRVYSSLISRLPHRR